MHDSGVFGSLSSGACQYGWDGGPLAVEPVL